MVRYRGAEGCTTVEMECAALAACARKRGASFGQILYTADSLANIYGSKERVMSEPEMLWSAHAERLVIKMQDRKSVV